MKKTDNSRFILAAIIFLLLAICARGLYAAIYIDSNDSNISLEENLQSDIVEEPGESSSLSGTLEDMQGQSEQEQSEQEQSEQEQLAGEQIGQTNVTQEKYKQADRMTVVMVGDILLHTPVEDSAVQEDGSRNFDALFVNTSDDIRTADLAIVNQEVIIGGEELGVSGYPAFNAPYEIGDALVTAGFDVVCHATNHALDKGKKGVLNTLNFWDENYPDMGVIGIYDSSESQDDIYIYECNGIKVAILNYTYGTNGIALPEDMPYAVNLLSEQKVTADIEKAEELADFTIVCPHWGTEYSLSVSDEQSKWTEIFLESGVDLVLGTHPHVIEPIEWVEDEEGENRMLVYYSLGNYVNWTSGTGDGVANRMVGGMAQITLERGDEGKVYIADYGIEPLVSHVEEGINGVTVYRLSDYTEELAGRNAIAAQDPAFSLDHCRNLCDRVWPDCNVW